MVIRETVCSPDKKQPKVVVLMSVYNGNAFLDRQIHSILCQTYQNFCILIRDDGSESDTKHLLEEMEYECRQIRVIYGTHVGAASSFFKLLEEACAEEGDFFAFSDQDDYWLPRKLEKAVSALISQPPYFPALYASRVTLTDGNLTILPDKLHDFFCVPGFGNALIENICFGCTEVFNRPLLELAQSGLSRNVVMHDWWLYLLAACFGTVCFDHDSYILYRQHGGNCLGAGNTWRKEWSGRLSRARVQRGKAYQQALEFAALYTLPERKKEVLELFINYRKNLWQTLKALRCRELHRQRPLDQVVFQLLLLVRYV